MPIYNTETETQCGWGIYLDGQPICSRNPAPKGSDPNNKNCPALDIRECCYALEEHMHCPALAAKGLYSARRRRR